MENLLDEKLGRLATEGRVGLMAHLVAGYRSLAESKEIARGLAENGADILEIQIPFSDPTADGPVITAACQAALRAGTRPRDALELARDAVASTGVPVLLMSYANILVRWPGGMEAFLAEAAAGGIAGIIVPDLPPEEEDGRYYRGARAAGLHPILVVSPNVPAERLRVLAPHASGLIYATARVGTTGAASDLGHDALKGFLTLVHETCGLPIAVGFGIRNRAQIDALAGSAEVAVVGSQLLRALDERGVEAVFAEVRALAGR